MLSINKSLVYIITVYDYFGSSVSTDSFIKTRFKLIQIKYPSKYIHVTDGL